MSYIRQTLNDLGLHGELADWAASGDRDLVALWRECPRGDWLVRIALRIGADRRSLVRAAAGCVEQALLRMPTGEPRPRRALEAARRWVDGQAAPSECWACAFDATQAAQEAFRGAVQQANAALAAASLAFACDGDADLAYYAQRSHASEAVALSARAIGGEPGPRGRDGVLAAFANIARREIPFSELSSRLEQAVRASKLPPPCDDAPPRDSSIRGPGFALSDDGEPWFESTSSLWRQAR